MLVWNIILTAGLRSLQKKNTEDRNQTGQTVISNIVNGYTTDLTKTVSAVQSSIVAVSSYHETKISRLTGIIYRVTEEHCYIVTNAFPIEDGSVVRVRFDNGIEIDGTLIGRDLFTDTAVIDVLPPFQTKAISVTDSSLVKAGEYTIGIVAGDADKETGPVNFGVVSEPSESVETHEERTRIVTVLTTDIIKKKDMTGAPLLNLSGNLIGLVSDQVNVSQSRNNYTCAVSANEIRLAADQMIETGMVSASYLGILGRDVSRMEAYEKSAHDLPLDLTSGIYVTSVMEDSPAALAGIAVKDVLISMADQPCTDRSTLEKLLYTVAPGTEVGLLVLHQGSEEVRTAILQ